MKRLKRFGVACMVTGVLITATSAYADGCDDEYYRQMYAIAALRAAGELDDWWEMYLTEGAQRDWNACKIATGAFAEEPSEFEYEPFEWQILEPLGAGRPVLIGTAQLVPNGGV